MPDPQSHHLIKALLATQLPHSLSLYIQLLLEKSIAIQILTSYLALTSRASILIKKNK